MRVVRINKDQLLVEEEEFLESTSLRQLADEYLPETQPRYIVISYQYNSSDGRSSQPLIFIYWSPLCVKPETHMLYAGAKMHVVQVCECSGKCYEVRDLDQFNDEWMHEKLAFFR
jgi:hypothetical protein